MPVDKLFPILTMSINSVYEGGKKVESIIELSDAKAFVYLLNEFGYCHGHNIPDVERKQLVIEFLKDQPIAFKIENEEAFSSEQELKSLNLLFLIHLVFHCECQKLKTVLCTRLQLNIQIFIINLIRSVSRHFYDSNKDTLTKISEYAISDAEMISSKPTCKLSNDILEKFIKTLQEDGADRKNRDPVKSADSSLLDENYKLKNDLQYYNLRCEYTKQKLLKVESEFERINSLVTSMQKKEASQRKLNETAVMSSGSAKSEHDALVESLQQLTNEAINVREAMRKRDSEKNRILQECGKLRSKLHHTNLKMNHRTIIWESSFRSRVASLAKKNEQLSTQVRLLHEKNSHFSNLNDKMSQEIKDLNDKLRTLSRDRESLKMALRERHSYLIQNQRLKTLNEHLADEVKLLRLQNEYLIAKSKKMDDAEYWNVVTSALYGVDFEADEKISRLESKVEEQSYVEKLLKEKIVAVEDERRHLEERTTRWQRDICGKLRPKLEKAESVYYDISRRLETLRNTLVTMSEERRWIKSSLENFVKTNADANDKLKHSLVRCCGNIKRYAEQCSDITKDFSNRNLGTCRTKWSVDCVKTTATEDENPFSAIMDAACDLNLANNLVYRSRDKLAYTAGFLWGWFSDSSKECIRIHSRLNELISTFDTDNTDNWKLLQTVLQRLGDDDTFSENITTRTVNLDASYLTPPWSDQSTPNNNSSLETNNSNSRSNCADESETLSSFEEYNESTPLSPEMNDSSTVGTSEYKSCKTHRNSLGNSFNTNKTPESDEVKLSSETNHNRNDNCSSSSANTHKADTRLNPKMRYIPDNRHSAENSFTKLDALDGKKAKDENVKTIKKSDILNDLGSLVSIKADDLHLIPQVLQLPRKNSKPDTNLAKFKYRSYKKDYLKPYYVESKISHKKLRRNFAVTYQDHWKENATNNSNMNRTIKKFQILI